jgi:UDP-N-acetylglucosamine:LPS N-acetylglucosamine transferase
VRIGLVGSSGGHLAQLLVLRPWWGDHERFWVTFDKPDARSALVGERSYWCHFPTNRNLPNLLRNTWLAVKVLRRERPDVIVSTGAAVAVPFFLVGKLLFRCHTVYVEVVDRVDHPTLTGRLVRPLTDRFLVQWPEQTRLYRGAIEIGRLM